MGAFPLSSSKWVGRACGLASRVRVVHNRPPELSYSSAPWQHRSSSMKGGRRIGDILKPQWVSHCRALPVAASPPQRTGHRIRRGCVSLPRTLCSGAQFVSECVRGMLSTSIPGTVRRPSFSAEEGASRVQWLRRTGWGHLAKAPQQV